jgi:hypothetical protein
VNFMKRVFLLMSWMLCAWGLPCAAEKVGLLSATDPAGYLARLLINEVPFPGERGYISEEDTKATMRALVLVIDSRIRRIPPGYRRSEVAYVDSDNMLDIITAGGVRGQMDGFYYSNGRPAMASRVTERVNNLLKIANKGEPGRFARLLRYAQALATSYVKGAPPQKDIYSGINKIPPYTVTGRAYGWMTASDYYHPGGCFVKIPDNLRGKLGGNRFFTLKVRRAGNTQPSTGTKRPVVTGTGRK